MNYVSKAKADEPWAKVTYSGGLPAWLIEQRVSLAFTTYQAGKLFLVGVGADEELCVLERTFDRCMGLWSDGQTIWLSSAFQLWRLENILHPGQTWNGHDKLFVPRAGYTTGDLHIHDIAVDRKGRVLFVNTRFSCLATLDSRENFSPMWKPAFISELAAEDRCHLNGVATADGRACHATAAAATDIAEGWRDHRRAGGCLIDMASDRNVVEGLSMPHSPRHYQGRLWLHNSGTGFFGWADTGRGRFEPLTFCPGYLRGLAFVGDYAVAGVSRPRDERTFEGLELHETLLSRGVEAWCGLQVIDLRSGGLIHWLRVEGMVSELYDVAVLANTRHPAGLGFKTDEIQRMVSIGPWSER